MKKVFFILIACFLFTINGIKASIVYRDIADFTVNSTTTLDIDFNNDGTAEFTLSWQGDCVGTMSNPPSLDFVTWSASTDWDVFKNITLNTPINSSSGFFTQGDCYFNPSWTSSGHLVPTNTDIYIGVKFPLNSNEYYGWVRVNIASGTSYVTVKDYAYENTPNTAINAGNTGTTAISGITGKKIISVSPVPCDNIIRITSDLFYNSRYYIFDVTGNEIKNGYFNSNENFIDIAELPGGVYFIKFPDLRFTSEIVKR